MPLIPIPEGVRRAVTDDFDEREAKRYREESDAKLERLAKTKMAELSKDEPLNISTERPPWMGSRGYDTPDFTSSAAPTVEPALDDPNRDYSDLGVSGNEDLSVPVAPEGEQYAGFGTGGPEQEGSGGLSEASIIDIRKRLADRENSVSDKDMRSTLYRAGTPDEAASAIELAGKAGVNRAQVEANRETYKRAETMKDIEVLRTTAPKLRAWLDYNPENLEVAHDAVQGLSWWEQAGKTGGEIVQGIPGALGSGYLRISEGAYGVARVPFELNDQFVSYVTRKQQVSDPSKFFAGMQAEAKAQADAARGEQSDDPTARGVLSGFESIPVSAMAAIMAVMSGGATAPLAFAGGVTGGSEYGTAREQGLSPTSSAGYGLGQGMIEAGTEMLPTKWLIGDISKRTPFFEMLSRQALGEGVTEQVATHSQDLLSWAVLPENADKPFSAYLEERGGAAYETLLASLIGSGVQTAVAKGVDETLRAADEGYRQMRSEELARTFDAMAKGASTDALLNRLPDKYREVVAQVTKDGPLESVRIQPEAITELAQSQNLTTDQLAQAWRIDPEDVNAAIASGEDVVIPSGNYAAVIQTAKKELGVSGETIHAALAPSMRLRPDDFTAREQTAMKAMFEDERKAREETTTTEQGFADSADRVREAIREQVTGAGIFNADAANTQAALIGEMVTTLAERTGQDPETLWKEQGFDIVTALKGEDDGDSLAQAANTGVRAANPPSDAELVKATRDLTEREFEAWKGAREGLNNQQIADRMNEVEPDADIPPSSIGVHLLRAREKGYDSEKTKNSLTPETLQIIELAAQGLKRSQIAARVYPDKDATKARNQVGVLVHRHKAAIEAKRQEADLAQGQRGTFSPRADRNVIRLFESANLSTLAHEGAHWYLDTLWRMAQVETPHPFVLEQIAAILEWQGKSPNWTAMFNPDGSFTAEGRDVQEAFAESFEAYLMEGKAPTTALRSVFASFKQWLLSIYKRLTSNIGGRVKLNDEVRQVFDRMLATDEAIKAVHTGMARNSAEMAQALLKKGVITERQVERTTARIQAARERAEAELMARLMDDYQRDKQAWWRDQERQTRREVQSEVDERPEQRAYAWLTGKGWKDTREAHTDQAVTEADAMFALQQAPELGYFLDNATDESIRALQQRMVDNGIIPVVLLFKTSTGRVIAFPGDAGQDFGFHHNLAREAFGLGDLKLEHGVWNPRKWPTIEAMNAAGEHAWYGTSGTQADAGAYELAQRSARPKRLASLAQTVNPEGLLVYRGSTDNMESGVGRLGTGLYAAEDPEIGAEWGGEAGTVDAFRINGRLFDLDETTAEGLENYAKAEDTPAAKKLFARLKAEGYVGVRDPWSGHINVFDAKDMVREASSDRELGKTWTNYVLDEEYEGEGASLAQSASAPIFYSQLARTVAQSSTSRAPAAQWKATLAKAPGVKADEIEWTGINDWLDAQDGPVTRAAIVEFLVGNGVRVEDVAKDGNAKRSIKFASGSAFDTPIIRGMIEVAILNGATDMSDLQMALENDGSIYREMRDHHKALFEEYEGSARDLVEAMLTDVTVDFDRPPAFSDYTLPGGTDYTEILLTLPQVKGPATHWETPNVLAHARFKTRTSPSGKKVLALEEIQSDWHQKGRKEGYEKPIDPAEVARTKEERDAVSASVIDARSKLVEWATKLNKEDLGHVVDEAVGFVGVEARLKLVDTIHATSDLSGLSETVAETMRSRIPDILAHLENDLSSDGVLKGRKGLATLLKTYRDVQLKSREANQAYMNASYPEGVPRAPFANNGWVSLVLKRMIRYAAENGFDTLAWIPGSVQNGNEVDTDDNRADFYDKIVPNAANKLGKKYGAEVGTIVTNSKAMPQDRKWHSLPITPELKEAALGGFSLFQSGGTTGRTTPPPNLPPMRLNLQAVKDQYGEQALASLPPEVVSYSAQATDADQFVQIARDVRKTLNRKRPKSLWKFLSTRRVIGHGNDKIAYSGIRDDGGELLKIIGEKKAAPGLIQDGEDSKKVRSYTIEHAANVAWEEGYFNGPNPPTPAEFLDALRSDFDGQAKLYARDDIETLTDIQSAEQWAEWFDQNGVDINEKDTATLRAQLETLLTGQQENAISPDEAAPFFKMPDGNALLEALKQGPKRNEIIRNETKRRMIEQHGDVFRDGTIMQAAEEYARNEVQQRQLEIELDALARATGRQAASNLAKQTAIENLRSKQVREVLNFNQWIILEQRWGRKALEAASKGDLEKAAEYKRYQLINFHMAKEGRKLAEQIEKTRKHLLDYEKKTKVARLYAAGPEYADQMRGLLDDYQLRAESKKAENRRAARGQWIAAQLASIDPFAAYQDTTLSPAEQQAKAAEELERSQTLANLADGVDARNYKSITVEELEGVRAEADMIWKLATLKDKLIKEGERRRLTLAADDIAAEVITNQPKEKPPEPVESDAPGEKVKRGVLKYFAMHRTLQSLAHQFAGGKDGGVFWSYIVKPLNDAYARLSTLRKQMGNDLEGLFGAYSKQEIARFYRDRRTFQMSSGKVALTTQGRLAVALNWGNEKNRQRLMDSMGWTEADVQQVLNTLERKDWDFIQKTWDYLDTWFPEANKVHENVHGAPMDKVEPMQIATRFGIYAGGYYPIAFDPDLSSKAAQRKTEADAKQTSGRVGVRSAPGFSKKRVEGKVTLPLKLSVFDVITRHLDQVATSIATEETMFDVGRLIRHPEVEDAIIRHHGRQIYNTIVNTLVTTKFGMEGTSGILAHLRNGATVVGLGWKVSTALLQPLGVTNSIVRVGGYWVAKGYARMGRDAATIQSSAKWIMDRSEFMRHRRQSQSPELAALKDSIKKGGITPRWLTQSMFSLMSNVQFFSVDCPTWFAGWYKAKAAGLSDEQAIAQADQSVIDSQGGGELHQTAAIQTGAGTKYAAALRLLTNFMSYMVTTYNIATQRARNADSAAKVAALTFDMLLLLSVPVVGKMVLDAFIKGGGDDDDDLLEKFGREQVAFLLSPFVGISQIAGAARGEDAFGYRGPAGLGIFAEGTNAGKAAAEGKFFKDGELDPAFWRPANRVGGMIFHYPASQIDATVRGATALWKGETDNPAAIFFGPPPAN